MRFDLSDDQRELREAVRSFLATTAPLPAVLAAVDEGSGYDPGTWARLATELELVGIAVPEEHRGAGAGIFELAVVAGEMGRVMYAGPFLSTILATAAVLAGDDEAAKAEYLPRLLGGELRATFAGLESLDTSRPAPVRARPDGEAWLLDGDLHQVVDGTLAEVVFVVADTDAGGECFAVEAEAAGFVAHAQNSIDLTRPLAQIVLEGAPARRIGADAGGRVSAAVLSTALACLAAEGVGGAEASLEMAVEYAKQRKQFGRAIGSFQAVKHLCANTHVTVEAAKSLAMYAAWAADHDAADAEVSLRLAKACCSDAFSLAAKRAIQVFGGIGFTWEHPAHLYLRRATSSRELFGSPATHRGLVSGRLFAASPVPAAGAVG